MAFKLKNHIIGKIYDVNGENITEMLKTIEAFQQAIAHIADKETYVCDDWDDGYNAGINAAVDILRRVN